MQLQTYIFLRGQNFAATSLDFWKRFADDRTWGGGGGGGGVCVVGGGGGLGGGISRRAEGGLFSCACCRIS